MKKRCMALFMALTVFAGQISGSALTAFAEDTGVQTEIAAAEASAETTAEEVSAEEQEILTKATAEPQEQETAPAETGPVEAENAQVPAEEQAPAAAEDTKIPAETQESTASEDAQTAAEEQVSATTADAQTAEAAPAEDYVEEAAVVGDAEELPQEESAEDAGAQDTTDGENAPFDPAAINLADSQISVEEASIEADPMLAEEELSEEDMPDFFITAVDSTELRGNDLTWLYTDGEDSVVLQVAGDKMPEDASVTWTLGYLTDKDDFVSLDDALMGLGSDRENKLTLTGEALAALDENVPSYERSKYYTLKATVSADGFNDMEVFLGIEARDPMHEYRLPYEVDEEIIRLPEQEIFVDGYLDFYIDDAEHPDPNPYDDEVNTDYPDSVQVTKVEVSLPQEMGEEVYECHQDDYENWHIILYTPCEEASFTVTYAASDLDPDKGEETSYTQSYDFSVIEGPIYDMNIASSTNTDRLLQGESLKLTADVWGNGYVLEDSTDDGEVSGYPYQDDLKNITIKWYVGDQELAQATNYGFTFSTPVNFEETTTDRQPHKLSTVTVTAKDVEEGDKVTLRAEAEDTDGKVCSQEFTVQAMNEYFQVSALIDEGENTSKMPYLEPMRSVEITPQAHLYRANGAEEAMTVGEWINSVSEENLPEQSKVEYIFHWNNEAIQIMDCKGNVLDPDEETLLTEADAPFTLTKLHPDETSVWLEARVIDKVSEEKLYWDNTELYFAGIDYNIWFDKVETQIYTDAEPLDFSVNSSSDFSRLDAEIYCTVGYYEESTDSFVPFDGTKYGITVKETDISINPAQLLAEGSPVREYNQFVIYAEVRMEGEPLEEDGGVDRWFNVWEAEEDNELPEKYEMFPGDEEYIPKDVNIWGQNQELGEYDVGAPIESVESGDESILHCEECFGEEDNRCGWKLIAQSAGETTLTVSYHSIEAWGDVGPLYSEELTVVEIPVIVGKLRYNLYEECFEPNHNVFVGQSVQIKTTLEKEAYNVDTEQGDEPEPVTEYELRVGDILDGENRFGWELSEDKQSLKITGKKRGYAEFTVEAVLPNGVVAASTTVWISIFSDEYYSIEPVEVDNVLLGEAIDLGEKGPQLIRHYTEDGEELTEAITDGVSFGWGNYDVNVWNLESDQSGDTESDGLCWGTLTRKSTAGSDVELCASYCNEENEDLVELSQQYSFDDLDYGEIIGWNYTYGDQDSSCVFAGAEQTLSIVGLPEDDELFTVDQWSVTYNAGGDDVACELDENDTDKVYYTIAGDSKSITLHVNSTEELPDHGITVSACVKYDGEKICRPETGVEICDPEYWICAEKGLIINEDQTFGYDESFGGYTLPLYVRDQSYPGGVETKVAVSKLESDDSAIVTTFVDDGTNLLHIKAVDYGECTIQVTPTENAPEGYFNLPEDVSLDFVLGVAEDRYYFGAISTSGSHASGKMLSTDTLKVNAEVLRDFWDEEGKKVETKVPVKESEYNLIFPEDCYDTDIISINSNTREITAKDGVKNGWASVDFYAELTDLNNRGALCWTDSPLEIEVVPEYFVTEGEKLYLEPGESGKPVLTTTRYGKSVPEGESASVKYEVDGCDDGLTIGEDNLTLQAADNIGKDKPAEVSAHVKTYKGSNEVTDARIEVVICEHELQEKVTKAPTCVDAGVRTITCSKCGYAETKEIPATGHTPGDWKTVSPATTEAPEKQQRTCTVCGTVIEERTVGEKLQPSTEAPSTPSTEAPSTPSTEATGTDSAQTPGTESAGAGSGTGAVQEPFIELNATSIPMKLKQSTKVIKVKMAEGDSIVSWESSNKKVVTVTKKGKIKAKKKGKATITVTLASGKTASFVVKVQKNKVTTKKVTGVTKKITLAKGKKYKLTPVLKPLTSQDKITYTSSNKKVATVDKKGNIQAKGKGTAKITVKSGKKKAVCTVTVR